MLSKSKLVSKTGQLGKIVTTVRQVCIDIGLTVSRKSNTTPTVVDYGGGAGLSQVTQRVLVV